MKILKICGKNLASLAGEFDVDFQREPLSSSGLFAISGPTGAGKSTLLDALCLALYDATPRLARAGAKGIGLPDVRDETLSQQDTRNLLRRGAADGYAEVDFIGNDGLAYRARWSVRRARSKAEGALQNVTMSLKRLPELQDIGGTKSEVKAEIERRIGLSFEQFTRAVLLAQNEFAAFLKADDGERGELLETLTGTAIYTEISRRAFERNKAEQQALQQLRGRLADQQPLAQEIRTQLEAEYAQAQAGLAVLEQRKNELEAQQRWHHAWQEMTRHEQAAQAELAARQADCDAAVARRSYFERVESVQPARALLQEYERCEAELVRAREAIAAGETELAGVGAALNEADHAVSQAQQALLDAEQAQSAAAPMLDRAKALDAQIEALQPAHAQAQRTLEQATAGERHAQQALRDNDAQRTAAQQERRRASAWLAQNARLHVLAEGWPRWDTLLQQAGQSVQEHVRAGQECAAARQDEARKKSLAREAQDLLDAAAVVLADATTRREEARTLLAGIDAAKLAARRSQAESRRDALADAAQCWQTLSAERAAHGELEEKERQLQAGIAQAQQALSGIATELPAAEAALAQAERSLKEAEAACGKNVESLRSALKEGAPCPVCGAHEHPYADASPQLHAVLARLQEEVVRCRTRSQQLLQQKAAHTALAAQNRAQLDACTRRLQTARQALDLAVQGWKACPAAVEAEAIDEHARAEWLTAQQQDIRAQLQAIAIEEQALHQAEQARDEAQRQLEQALAQHAARKDTASAAAAACVQATDKFTAANQRLNDVAARLERALQDLDAAFEDAAWREDWMGAPQAFHARRREQVEQWQVCTKQRDDGDILLGRLDAAHKELMDAHVRAQEERQRATEALSQSQAVIEQKNHARASLFDGKPVLQVQAELLNVVDAAKARLAASVQQRHQAATAETRCHEALKQAGQRLVLHTQAGDAAIIRLTDWIARFNAGQAPDAALDHAGLRSLLHHQGEWIAAERGALQALDASLQNARTVLRERQAQLQGLERQRLNQDSAQAVDAALAAVAVEREQAATRATALQLQLAEDDARRTRSAAMMAAIERQEATARVWGQLNELIGSADGKRFRNYAQQFTLDVLLGYANRHLSELSRRYRLERIKDTLALLVVDQDMGDEIRSVHSLSGGESFLVSLALALALASLSSNRVRVESLFIDEGFGSLDAETLSVAMDALDGLQAMGRKVGVISHVQEMTERIATRIVVRREAGGKSAVGVA